MLSQSNLELRLTLHSDILHLSEKVTVAQDAHKPVIWKIQGTPHTQLQTLFLAVSTLLYFYIICINCPEIYCLLLSSTINHQARWERRENMKAIKRGRGEICVKLTLSQAFFFCWLTKECTKSRLHTRWHCYSLYSILSLQKCLSYFSAKLLRNLLKLWYKTDSCSCQNIAVQN